MEPHDIATLSLSMCLDPVIAVQGEEAGPSVRLSICLSVRLYVCQSVCLSVRPSVCLSVCLSVSKCTYIIFLQVGSPAFLPLTS